MVEADPEDLEDVTDLIFSGIKDLSGCQMLCKPDLDLFDTMSSFEVMDPKMDARMHRKDVPNVQKAVENGSLIKADLLTVKHKIALFQEFMVQFATWQDQVALIQQTLYGCIYLTNSDLYADAADLKAFIHGLLYIVNTHYGNAIMTTVLRDEDINFP